MATRPELIDDLLGEVLLRLPPDEPEHLFRAAIVCKSWLRIVCDPAFRRRYRAFHGAPPLLGLLHLLQANVYSSVTGAWSAPVCLDDGCEGYAQLKRDDIAKNFYHLPYVMPRRVAVIGDAVYFTLRSVDKIVKYNLPNKCFSMISQPPHDLAPMALMVMEDSSLGFACINNSSLCLWSRKVDPEAAAEWVQCRVIELKKIIPDVDLDWEPFVVGSAEGVGVIFISTDAGLFATELKSGRVRKVDEPGEYFSVLPYMSFYTPASVCLLN
ncbi:hypothetical protein TRIUR3_12496 [Triticum urartu]|uniref:F-box domain-containing protein n=1 Tax=Triticum urartu TaxID=4572 RepID=M8A7V0_TRIUA|nr:hypothetical protein TRIUR3_12496 [Triticum urartu]